MSSDMLWKLYEREHNETTQKNNIYEQVYGHYHPQVLFADLDDRMIYEAQRNKQIKIKKNSFLTGNEETLNILFSRIYTVGKEIVDSGLDLLENKQKQLIDQINY